MSIQERLHKVIDDLKMSPSVFADRIGVQRSNLSHVLSGRNKPGLDFLEKIINHFPQINAHWLLTGKLKENDLPKEKNLVHKNEALDAKKEVDKIIIFYKDKSFDLFNA